MNRKFKNDISEMIIEGKSPAEILKALNCRRSTIYYHKNRLKNMGVEVKSFLNRDFTAINFKKAVIEPKICEKEDEKENLPKSPLTVCPIKVFGLYDELKEYIGCFPIQKEGGYIYIICFGNSTIKVGKTQNVLQRIKQHISILNKYGNGCQISSILVSKPLLQYTDLETDILKSLYGIRGLNKSGEFFKTDNLTFVLKTFLDNAAKYQFNE